MKIKPLEWIEEDNGKTITHCAYIGNYTNLFFARIWQINSGGAYYVEIMGKQSPYMSIDIAKIFVQYQYTEFILSLIEE